MRPVALAVLFLVVSRGIDAQEPLTDAQVREAIALGQADKIPIVQVGTFLGVSKGDFNVFIEGPMARIAGAAAAAFRQYRPFDVTHVTDAMKAPLYRVFLRESRVNSRAFPTRIVLQRKRARGMDGVIQPIREPERGFAFDAAFDQFPDGDFDVVVVTSQGEQRYDVSPSAREKIR